MTDFTRRTFLAGTASLAGLAVSGCVTGNTAPEPLPPSQDPAYLAMYRAMPEERFPLPAINLKKVPPRFYRQQVDYPTPEPVGTLVVDTPNYYLYLVQENGRAMRYGVGLGRAGFEWSGRARIARKAAWPKWTPPDEMIERQPELEKWSWRNGGMPPGLDNPLGARALYIFQGSKDTLYRVHGTGEYWTIGSAVSSGCVRLMNQDIIDLYGRVPAGSPIVVLS
ncbi:L,D-transpeptidase [Roseibium salinum]|uniref:L,D-transpeptidase n=1 Tax=Roseibium salinum TaxID=1604349 RepID=A0ABT3R9M8_9HYPH|nr:L,D-transpeptidase [Roseibium sp. DSM 29163]MCX2725737.1 L,D-transpeptidase [Roseibium sp. DSM 29163]